MWLWLEFRAHLWTPRVQHETIYESKNTVDIRRLGVAIRKGGEMQMWLWLEFRAHLGAPQVQRETIYKSKNAVEVR